jgi:hypothetical protein
MKHFCKLFLILQGLGCINLWADSVVVFNEVMYHPATNESALEWVELYNQNSINVDLSGWRISDGINYTFPNGTIIRAGDYLVVASSPSSLTAQTGNTNVVGPFSGRLANNGEKLELRNVANRVMDSFSYGVDGSWPAGPDGAGVSLAKKAPNLASKPAANWTVSSQIGGTPGKGNFSSVLLTGAKTNYINLSSNWRYNDAGTDLGIAWRNSGFDDSSWSSGPGVFFVEDSPLPGPKNTPLTPGRSTYYFRTTFAFNGDPAFKLLSFRPLVDDGIVLYLNGNEVARFNMPTGIVNYSTMAVAAVDNAVLSGPISISSSNLVPGLNVVAVELHQTASVTNAGLRVSNAAGYTTSWDGEDGNYFSPIGPAYAPPNDALSSAGVEVFASSNTNLASSVNDGLYGSGSSWSPATNDATPYLVLKFNRTLPLTSVAWSRDNGDTNETACGGTCKDRALGNYTLQYTLVTNPAVVVANSSNPSNGWTTVATVQFLSTQPGFTPHLRHRFNITANNGSPLLATGLRLRMTPTNTVDEVEVNPPATNTFDAVFGMELTSTDILPPPPKVSFNEISGANTNAFWLEVINYGASDVNLAGMQVVRTGSTIPPYSFPGQVLPPGGILSLSQAQLGFGAPDGSSLFLFAGAQFSLLDAVTVKTNARARYPDGTGAWVAAGTLTPGASNVFTPSGGVVINEIMYRHPPFDPVPPVTSNFTAVPIQGTWRFNDSGADLGSTWRSPGFDDSGWLAGTGLFAFNATNLPAPTATILAGGRSTYYFRTTFPFSGSTSNLALKLRPVVDDGAVFYLNGVEIFRVNMPPGPVTASTSASVLVGDAAYTGPISIPASNLVQGVNVLAVEVHQITSSSSASGLTLTGGGLTLVEEGPFGGTPPMNLARQPGAAPFVIDSLAGYPIHDYLHLDDGVYGNGNSWIGNSGNPGYAGIRFGGLFTISSFAFGRDNLGVYSDRTLGLYTLQYTRVATPGVATTFTGNPATGWATIGTLNYQGAGSGLFANPSRRHRYSFDPVQSTGIRLLVPSTGIGSGICIDELEVNPPDTSGDIVFGTELVLSTTLAPAVPFTDSSEEWVELFNWSSNSVDLTGWKLDGAISYRFANGTTIAPNDYLVVANNTNDLRTKWPEVATKILGNFNSKMNPGETIRLEDPSSYPVAIVTVYDLGWSDGGGSSLELIDPRADHRVPEAWADSDESANSTWQTVTYRMVAGQTFGPTLWNEFRLGLVDGGEALIDDVSVVRDPDGTRQQLIQNGNFESTSGNTHWRMLGDHGASQIIPEPGNPANHVLKVVASSPPRTSHNHIESTFVGNTPLIDGQEYEVSYRARWLGGPPLVGTTTYFQRMARTTTLHVPLRHGTPGAPNSRRQSNLGPTFSELKHFPVIPPTNQPVMISVAAADPDGITSITLFYRVNPSPTFLSLPMALQSDGSWSGTIPGQSAGKIVQFYVGGADNLGASSVFPRQGPGSRALYQVADAQGTALPVHELRVIQLDADRDFLLNITNVMSQEHLGATVIYDRSEVFYDAGIRLHGSAAGRARDGDDYISYELAFPSTHLFRGVQGSVGIDRSGRAPVVRQQDEVYIMHMFERAGLPVYSRDLCYFIAPKTLHTGTAIVQLDGYGGLYVNEQFKVNGSVFNCDITYEPTTTIDGGIESVKVPVPLQGHIGTDFTDLGNDKEQYRYPFDMRHGERHDDFSGIIRLCQTMVLPQDQFDAQIFSALDVDEALRATALTMLCGIGDNYYNQGGLPHNLRLFSPFDGSPTALLPWDMDFIFTLGSSSSIYPGTDKNLYKLINNPATKRLYLSHIYDLCQNVFNSAYMSPWLTHYGSVVGQIYTGGASYIESRKAYALSQLPAATPFSITSNNGNDFLTNTPMVTIRGNGWLDVWKIRLGPGTNFIVVNWPALTSWEATVPLLLGTNLLNFQALDRNGNLLASKNITVTTTATGGGVDSDGDGLPDAWELANGLNPLANDASQDNDGDGLSNLQEYLTGTNPNDAHSFLRIDAANESLQLRLNFYAAAGRSYSILYRDSLDNGSWTHLADVEAGASDRLVNVTVPKPLPAALKYFKLVTPKQP